MPAFGSLILPYLSGNASCASNSDLDLTGQTATIECWLRGIGFIVNRIVAGKTNNTTSGYMMRVNAAGQAYLAYGTGAALTSGAVGGSRIDDGTWRHVAVVKSAAGNVSLVNGAVVASSAVGAGVSLLTNAQGFFLNGVSAATTVGHLQVAELRVWNTARTTAEILGMRDVLAVGNETGLVGCWHLNDNTGTSATDAAKSHALTLTDCTWAYPAVPAWQLALGSNTLLRGTPDLLWEGDTTGPDLVEQSAHYYTVEVTDWGEYEPQLAVPVGVWLPDVGHVAVVGPAGAIRQVLPLQYAMTEVWPAIVPADGLYLNVKPGVVCHTQAWALI